MSSPARAPRAAPIWLAHAFFVVLVLAASGFGLAGIRSASLQARELETDALVSQRLVERLRLLAARLERVALQHALNREAGASPADEADVAALREQIRATSAAYQPLTLYPGEAEGWAQLQRLLARSDALVEEGLRRGPGRAGRDGWLGRMSAAEAELDQVSDRQVQINSEAAARLVERLRATQRRSLLGLSVLTLAAVLLGEGVLLAASVRLAGQRQALAGHVAELEELNRELDAFAARVAHDLGSALTPLRAHVSRVRRHVEEPEVLEELAGRMEASIDRLAEFIASLLAFSRTGVRSGGRAELGPAVAEVVEALGPAGWVVRQEVEAGAVCAIDPALLRSVLANLVGNAVKFMAGRPDPRVRVTGRRERGWVVLAVADNGPGIGPEDLARLAQPFFRSPRTAAVRGHGLGLATVKRIVDRHGGTLSVRSALGAGTTVVVTLPAAGPAPAPAAWSPGAEAHPPM